MISKPIEDITSTILPIPDTKNSIPNIEINIINTIIINIINIIFTIVPFIKL